MPVAIRDELDLLEDNLHKLAARAIGPHVEAMEHGAGAPPPEVIAGLEELGLWTLALPASAGGDEAGREALARTVGVLAETSPAVATMLLAHAFAQRLVARTGHPEALARIAVDGDGRAPRLAYPLYTEPTEGGRHAIRIQGEDHPWLTGRWDLVVLAPAAHRLVLPVQPADGGAPGLALVDADAPQVEMGEPVPTLGMRGCPVADVRVRELPLHPGQWVDGEVFHAALLDTHREMRAAAVALSAGIARTSVRTAVAYARERVQGGRPIIEHPEVRRILGDMMADAELGTQAARLLCDDALPEAAAVGWLLRARAAAARATCDGVQVLGGNGYMEDYGQERCMRDAKQAQCLLGRHEALHQAMLERRLTEVAP